MLEMSDNFRVMALSTLSGAWAKKLPGIPMSRNELKQALKVQQETDELTVLRLLETLDSESATVLLRLDLTRDIIAAALAQLQHDHPAQVNLLSILGGSRFKYAIHGVLVPTRCPNILFGRPCNKEDSYLHLLECYSLQTEERPGVAAIKFPGLMARRTVTNRPGVPTPRFGM